jgi:hypothetical protein
MRAPIVLLEEVSQKKIIQGGIPLTLAGFPVEYPKVYTTRPTTQVDRAAAANLGCFNPITAVL